MIEPRDGLQPGRMLGPYRLTRPLGRGASSAVFAADGPEGPVIVKVATRPDAAWMLRREARFRERVRHPAILPLLALRMDLDPPLAVFADRSARSLRQLLTEHGRLAPVDALEILCQLLSALAEVHRQGGVHCDLKPENLLLGDGRRLTLIDFGLGRLTGETRVDRRLEHTLRTSLDPTGTLAYLAPEVRDGASAPSPGTDLYATGVLLFEMLVGRLPGRFERPGQHVARPPARLDEYFERACCRRQTRLVTAAEARRVAQAALRSALAGLGPEALPAQVAAGQPADGRVAGLVRWGGGLVAAYPEDGGIGRLVEIDPQTLAGRARLTVPGVHCVAAAGGRLACVDRLGQVRLRRPDGWVALPSAGREPDRVIDWRGVRALTFAGPDRLLAAFESGTLARLDLPRGVRAVCRAPLRQLWASADPELLLTLGRDGRVALARGWPPRPLAHRDGPAVERMWVDPAGRRVVLAVGRRLELWSLWPLERLAEQRLPATPEALCWAPRGRWVASGDRHGVLRVHDPRTLLPVAAVAAGDWRVCALAWAGRRLIAGLAGGGLIALEAGAPRATPWRTARRAPRAARGFAKHALPPLAGPARFRRGQSIGDWTLVRPLGRGGSAEVWLARGLDASPVAVKLAREAEGEPLLLAAAAAHAAVRDPAVLPLLAIGTAPVAHVVMRWCGQMTLRQLIDTGNRCGLALALFGELLTALTRFAAAAVVHGDLKPENILLETTPRGPRLWLTDLGQPRAAPAPGSPAPSLVSDPQHLAGTAAYVSPARRAGAPASPADDGFALGTVFYELVTGRRPDLLERPSDEPERLPAGLRPGIADRIYTALCRPGDVPALRRLQIARRLLGECDARSA